VVGKDRLDKKRLANLQEAFQESELPFRVDIHDWHGITEKFRKVIAEKFEIIQGGEASPLAAAPLRGSSATPLSGGHPRCAPGEKCKVQSVKCKVVPLGTCTKWFSGGTPSKAISKYWNGNIPWISASSMYTNHLSTSSEMISAEGLNAGSRLAPKGSILLLVRGSMLHQKIPLGIAERDLAFNQDVKAVVSDETVMNQYLYLWFLSKRDELLGMVEFTGIGAGKLDTDRLQAMPIRIPSIDEQRKIVEFGCALDDRIELNRKMNETLEAMARALFQSWFVDFDPVIDKALASRKKIPAEFAERAERRKALGTKRKVLPKEVLALFPDEFEESSMGWIPKGWKVDSLQNICTEIRRGIPPKYVDQGGVIVLNQKCIRNHSIDYAPSRKHDASERSIDGRELQVGDVLVNSTGVGTLGRIAPFFGADEPIIIDGHISLLRSNPQVFLKNGFAAAMLNVENAIEALGEGSTGQTELSREIFKKFCILVPPVPLQKIIEPSLKDLNAKLHSSSKHILALAEIRDRLLPKLISGELSIPDAENLLDGVTPSQPRKAKASTPIAAPVDAPVRETRAEDYTAEEVLALIRKSFRTLSSTVTDDELIRVVAQQMGYQRVSENVTSVIKNHLRTAIRRQVLSRPKNGELQLQTTSIHDYSTKDLAAVMATLQGKNKTVVAEELFRSTLAHLGFMRLSSENRMLLEKVMRSAKRRK